MRANTVQMTEKAVANFLAWLRTGTYMFAQSVHPGCGVVGVDVSNVKHKVLTMSKNTFHVR